MAISLIFVICFFCIIIFLGYKITTLKFRLEFLNQDNIALKQENNKLCEQKIDLLQKNERLTAQISYQEQYIAEFGRLNKQSEDLTKAALFDLGKELSNQLVELHKKENKESRELSEKTIKDATEKFNGEFERIVGMVASLNSGIQESKSAVDIIKNSLLSPSGAGKLAEITLENILKASGLRNGTDFSMQYTAITEEGNKIRPDALIFLPSDNVMIIDAKASKFLVDQVEEKQGLVRTMNNHLKNLSAKDYISGVAKSLENKATNIIMVMFLPTEHAIEKIIDLDPGFLEKAWRSNIYPAGPIGLMNMLSFAKFRISEKLMMQNHQNIIKEVKKLIDSVGNLTEYSAKIGHNIQSLVSNYDKFAASFNHNFLYKARNISNLGIESSIQKVNKPLERYQLISSKSDLIELEPETDKETLMPPAKTSS